MLVRIAVVGADSMGMNHLRVLKDFDDEKVQLVGAAETHEPTLKCAMSRFHVAGYAEVDDTLPAVSGEDGLAVLKIVQQLAESTHFDERGRRQPAAAAKVEV